MDAVTDPGADADLACPRCGDVMQRVARGLTYASQCPRNHGVFLERADLGSLVEAETDWHDRQVQDTAQLPRITGDLTAPPVVSSRPKAWIATLFG